MKTLYLPLKKEWYEMIEAGIKKEEYREESPYWRRRLIECYAAFNWCNMRGFDGRLCGGGLVFGTESDANSEVIGWREIHE